MRGRADPAVNQLGMPLPDVGNPPAGRRQRRRRRLCKAHDERFEDRGRPMNGFEIIQVITLIVAAMLLSVVLGVSWVTQRIEQHGIEQRRLRRNNFNRE
jgi:hypothetical protein